MFKLRFIILTALAGFVIAGCGGGGTLSKADYKKKLQSIRQEFRASATGIQSRLRGNSDNATKLRALDQVKGQFSQLADKLNALKAPSDVKPAQDKVVATLRDESTNIAKLSSAARSNNNSQGQAALTALQQNNIKLVSGFSELNAKLGK